MSKTVIGIDVGMHSLKAACLSGTAKSPVLVRVATLAQTAMAGSIQQATEKAVAAQLKDLVSLLKSAKGECHFSFNSPSAVLRYVETPFFPQKDLRASLKFNHQSYLRQSYENFTFDGLCLFAEPEGSKKDKKEKKTDVEKTLKKGKTLIAGLPNSEVLILFLAAKRAGLIPASLSLAALSLIDAFEASQPQAFSEQSSLLLDIGHLSSTVTIIHRGTVFLTRVVNLGGKNVMDYLVQAHGGAAQAESVKLEGGQPFAEAVHASLAPILKDVHSSVNFFERNTDTDLKQIYLSGMLVKSPAAVDTIQQEVGFPCQGWNAVDGMKIGLPESQRQIFQENQPAFAVAIGAARAQLD